MAQESRKLYSFTWKIENFSLCNKKTGVCISSPHFTIETLNHSKWYIKLYPKGNYSQNQDYVSIYLYRNDDISEKEKIIDYKFEAIDGNGTSLRFSREKNIIFKGCGNHGICQFIDCNSLLKEIHNWKINVLTIRCDVSSKQYNEDELITTYGCNAITKIGIDRCSFEWNLNRPDSPVWAKKKKFSFLPVPIEITISAPNDAFEINIKKAIEFPNESRPISSRFSIVNFKGNKAVSKWDFHSFESDNTWKFPFFLAKKQLEDDEEDFVQANAFKLECEICIANKTLISCIENYVFQSLPEEISMPEAGMFSSLHRDLKSMFTLKKHCDVKLQLGDDTFPAHKALLSARSPVFSAMFDQNMMENQTGVVNIDDIDASTMQDLLECIYTGSVKELDYKNASKLLIAADKYQILCLKRKCSEFLASNLSTANVCDVVSMAAVIDKPLKASAMDYLMKNSDKILSSEQWPDFVKNNHELATEVFLALSKSMKNVIS